jgi:hypothetical protein
MSECQHEWMPVEDVCVKCGMKGGAYTVDDSRVVYVPVLGTIGDDGMNAATETAKLYVAGLPRLINKYGFKTGSDLPGNSVWIELNDVRLFEGSEAEVVDWIFEYDEHHRSQADAATNLQPTKENEDPVE